MSDATQAEKAAEGLSAERRDDRVRGGSNISLTRSSVSENSLSISSSSTYTYVTYARKHNKIGQVKFPRIVR
jgi:hypothetical protein